MAIFYQVILIGYKLGWLIDVKYLISPVKLTPLVKIFQGKEKQIESWFDEKWKGLHPCIYLSCDIRHSGFKMGVVDTNLFPAGFNNLCKTFSRETSQAFRRYLDATYPDKRKILIYAEEHTRNRFYLENLLHLRKLIEEANREVSVGVLGDTLNEPQLKIDFEAGSLVLGKIERVGKSLQCASFKPDLVLSNNDFSTGLPPLFEGLDLPIVPSPELGWHRRRKKRHFDLLTKIIQEFADHFQIDPWRLSAYTEVATGVDFSSGHSLKTLAEKVESLLKKIRKKYAEYRLTQTPYVYLKNNAGTYGLGSLPFFSGDEILALNRKKRNKLLSSKGGVKINEYLIQEGIPTADFYSGYPIEPVIYVVGKKAIGGFFRIHEAKTEFENLNSPGMTFSCLCLHKLNEPHEEYFLDCHQKEDVVLASRLLAEMAALAAAREIYK